MSLLEICWGSGILQSLITLAGRDFAAVIRLEDRDKKGFCDTRQNCDIVEVIKLKM